MKHMTRITFALGLSLGVLVLLLGLTAGVQADPPDSWYVDPTGADAPGCGSTNSPCLTVGYAISEANSLATVIISPGLYLESNISVTKPITITGVSRDNVVIAPAAEDDNVDSSFGGTYQHGFIIQSDDVTIQSLTLDGQANDSLTPGKNNFRLGIVTDSGAGTFSRLRVEDVTVQHIYRRGIQTWPVDLGAPGDGFVVTDCLVDDVTLSYGILLVGPGKVANCTVSNTGGRGIGVYAGAAEITGNTVSHTGLTSYYDAGIWTYNYGGTGQTIIAGNTITGVDLGFNIVGMAEGSLIGGPDPVDRNTVDLTDNVTAGIGILVWYTNEDLTIQNNEVLASGGDAGIWLFHNEEPTRPTIVRDNVFAATDSNGSNPGEGTGIFVTDDGTLFGDEPGWTYATLTGNTITGFARGVDLYQNAASPAGGRDVHVTVAGGNTISGCEVGVRAYEGDSTGMRAIATLVDNANSITGNDVGIDVDGGVVTATRNAVTFNGTGVNVTNGGVLTATHNTIAHNVADGVVFSTTAASGTLHGNVLCDNGGFQLDNGMAGAVDAAGNWWGHNAPIVAGVDYSGTVGASPNVTFTLTTSQDVVDGAGGDTVLATVVYSDGMSYTVPDGVVITWTVSGGAPAMPSSVVSDGAASVQVMDDLESGMVITATDCCGFSQSVTILAGRVQNMNTSEWFHEIQPAIDDVDTMDGHTILASSGIFTENVVIDKAIELAGTGQASTVIRPATSVPTCTSASSLCGYASTNLVIVQADGVTVHDLTLDGDNPTLVSGIERDGADLDARNGVIADYYAGTFDDLEVYSVTVQNIYLRGIYAASGGTFNFHHNTVRNVQGESQSIAMMNWAGAGTMAYNHVEDCNDGIVANHSTGTQFLYNEVIRSGVGVHTDNAGDSGGTADLIQGNVVGDCAADGWGVIVFVPRIAPAVQDNLVDGCSVGLAMAGGVGTPVNTVFANNWVTGTAGSTGAYVTTNMFGWGSDNVAVTFDDNIVTGHDTGFYVEAEPGYSIHLTATGNTVGDSLTTGMVFTGTGSIEAVVGGAMDDANVFTGNSTNISVTLPSTNPDILATYNDWGVTGLADIEATLHHQVDDATLAEVVYYDLTADAAPATVYADGSSFATVTGTLMGLYAPAGNAVDFATDLGTLSAASAVADPDGNAMVTLSSSVAETASVTATAGMSAGNPITAATSVEFVQSPLDHFVFAPVADQVVDADFTVTITAADSVGGMVTGYNGYADLADGSGAVDPTMVGPFVDGVWSGPVSIGTPYAENTLTATHPISDGVTGSSNAFTVTYGVVDYFTFAAIGEQIAGKPFAITVTAYDAYDNVITDFGDMAVLTDTTETISPTMTGAFVDGIWSGEVTIEVDATDVVITATYGGASGASNPFDVIKYYLYLPLVTREG